MKILFLTPDLPSRIRVRPYEFLRVLSERGHRLSVGTPARPGAGSEALGQLCDWGVDVKCFPLGLPRRAGNVLHALSKGQPMQYRYAWQPRLAAWAHRELKEGGYDLVHVEHLRMALLGSWLKRRLPHGPPVLWDAVDSISGLLEQAQEQASSRLVRFTARLELAPTRECEASLQDKFDAVVVTSSRDREWMEETKRSRVPDPPRVVANGVDCRYFSPADDPHPAPETLVFSGKMSYHANLSAALYLLREILPLVWKVRPAVRVLIVGKSPPGVLCRSARRLGGQRVDVVGGVPDLRPYLRRATIAVAPLTYAAGVQNKVLEALACGLPLVASPSAVGALAVRPGKDLLVGATPQAFSDCILRLLSDSALRKDLGARGRNHVLCHHDWSRAGDRLEGIYRSLIESSQAQSGTGASSQQT